MKLSIEQRKREGQDQVDHIAGFCAFVNKDWKGIEQFESGCENLAMDYAATAGVLVRFEYSDGLSVIFDSTGQYS